MPRTKKVDRPQRLEARIPQSVYARTVLELHSEVENRVPFGAISNLITELLIKWLESRGIVV